MPAAAIIGAVGAIGGAAISSSGAKSAAKTAAKADAAAIEEQRRQFDIAQQNQEPYLRIGGGALNQLAALYGIPQYSAQQSTPQGSGQYGGYGGLGDAYQNYLAQGQQQPAQVTAPDYSTFYNSPDYGFARTEGQRGMEQSAAARGGAFSGNALKALSTFNQGLASQQYGNYVNRLQSLAGIGQSATQSLGGLGQNYASNVGNLLSNQGNTRASGIQAQSNAWGNALQSLGGIAQDWYQNRTPTTTQGSSYYGGL